MKQVRKYIIGGMPGTGKSTIARVLMQEQPLTNHLVIEPDAYGDGWKDFGYPLMNPTPQNLWQLRGYNRVVWNEDNKTLLEDIFKNVTNSCICFDDCYFLMKDLKTYRTIEKIMGRARQKGNHVFLTIHGFASVPAPFWTYPTDVIVMKTGDQPDRAAYKIPGFENFEKAIEAVNNSSNDRALVHIKRTL